MYLLAMANWRGLTATLELPWNAAPQEHQHDTYGARPSAQTFTNEGSEGSVQGTGHEPRR